MPESAADDAHDATEPKTLAFNLWSNYNLYFVNTFTEIYDTYIYIYIHIYI